MSITEQVVVAERHAAIDDVLVLLERVHYDNGSVALRLRLDQLALDKSYVDLEVSDAIWLAYSILRALERLMP